MINRKFAESHPHRLHSLVIMNSPIFVSLRHNGQWNLVRSQWRGRARWQRWRRRWNVGLARPIVRIIPRVGCCAQLAVVCGRGQLRRIRVVLADGVKEFSEKGNYQGDYPCLVMTCENDSGSTPAMSRAIVADFARILRRARLRYPRAPPSWADGTPRFVYCRDYAVYFSRGFICHQWNTTVKTDRFNGTGAGRDAPCPYRS